MNTIEEQKIYNTLEAFGLSTLEVTVYLTNLKLGAAQASVISRRLSLNRSTTRYTLENLVKKKLLIQSKKNQTFYFTPENPEKIIMILKDQQAQLRQKEDSISNIIGDLKSLQNPHLDAPKVHYFEGTNGVKNAYQNIIKQLENGSEVLIYARPIEPGQDKYHFTEDVENFIKERVSKKVSAKLLTIHSPTSELIRSSDKKARRETRILPQAKFPNGFASEIIIYNNSVCSFCATPHNLFAHQVTHPELAAMQKYFFNLLWDQYPRVS